MKIHFIFLVSLSMVFGSVTAQLESDNSLIGYWPFNGNAMDESGNGYNGTVNGPELTNDRLGNPESAYLFDGIQNYIALPNLFSTAPDAVTMAAWFNSTSEDEGKILYHGNKGEFQLLTIDSTAIGAVHLLQGWHFVYADFIPETWYFLVCIWEKGETLRLYLNGALTDTATVPESPLFDPGPNYPSSIGSYGRTIAYYFTGIIDDVRLYDRALSEEEINSLYDIGTTDIKELSNPVSGKFELQQNVPNPFNNHTTFHYNLKVKTYVRISIFDISGRELSILTDGLHESGEYQVIFDGSNFDNGIYYCKIQTRFGEQSRKLMVLK